MESYNKSYRNIAFTTIMVCETVMCGLLFYGFSYFTDNTVWEKAMNAPKIQVTVLIMMIYALSVVLNGVVVYDRKTYLYEVIKKVISTNVCFALAGYIILTVGQFMDSWSYMFVGFLVSTCVASTLFRIAVRKTIKNYRSKGGNLRFSVLVGGSKSMAELYEELTIQKWAGYRVKGYFDFEPSELMPKDCPYLGRPEQVKGYMEKYGNSHYLFCGLDSRHSELIREIMRYCENHIIRFYSIPDLYEYTQSRMVMENVGNVPVMCIRREPLSYLSNKIMKRTMDLVISTIFLCTLFPIILIIVTVITKITMPGPVFFKQKRNGLDDVEFYCLKFRSMKVNADADRVQATKNDPRKTKWGNIMRKTNIDELPQFINVFMGDMSLVGPRPHMVKHTEEYSKLIDKYMVRHWVKPGITGWSQVTGFRGETKELKDMENRIKGDIWYIEHWSIWLDLYIMYKTVANMIGGEKNAY
ncbi:undecaprenyl-phosphate glucose phosphotransferase [uncultured Bacteroides sp.]|uniref:undecaprenyl-phosphate glucose phosphotransferase n=1 Tax=uncultured Bacteroides sp. TaxID=162156 RepID=UPI00260C08EB|nr:undecaprenyl-phosphate glucose phosphotransferase [uncultured Bacteroides sp.]